jgi:hypothetical protein
MQVSWTQLLVHDVHTPGNLSAETETCDTELHSVVKSDKKHETDCLPHQKNKR